MYICAPALGASGLRPAGSVAMAASAKQKSKPEDEEQKKKKVMNNKAEATPTRGGVGGGGRSTKSPPSQKRTATKPNQDNNENKKKSSSGKSRGPEPDVEMAGDAEIVLSSSSRGESPELEIVEERDGKRSKNDQKGSAKSSKTQKRKKEEDGDESQEGEDGTMCRFPMARIKRIIKSENPSLQLGQDVVFLVNKAAEKFLEKFCGDAYRCSVRDRKKSIAYKHLSLVVSQQKRYDFLSDFVPEVLKAKDALEQRESMDR